MARNRDRKGRFKKGRSNRSTKRRVTRRRRKGGVGALGSPAVDAFVAPMVGGGVTAGTALAIRKFVDPTASEMKFRAVKWAGLAGGLAGAAASAGLYFLAGRDMVTLIASLSGTALAALALTAQDQVILTKPEGAGVGAALVSSNYAALTAGNGGGGGGNGTEGLLGTGARRGVPHMAMAGMAGFNQSAFGKSFVH